MVGINFFPSYVQHDLHTNNAATVEAPKDDLECVEAVVEAEKSSSSRTDREENRAFHSSVKGGGGGGLVTKDIITLLQKM